MVALFFVDRLSSEKLQILDGDEAHHAIKVMRLGLNEVIQISDGTGSWVSGPISELNKKNLKITVTSNGIEKKKMPKLVLIQAITKSDRIKEMLELVTAAGVDTIIPWKADRSISRWQSDSNKKWASIVKEACKQSRRVNLPTVENAMSTQEVVEHLASSDFFVIFHEAADKKFSDLDFSSAKSAIHLIIGPEGGITEGEISSLSAAQGNLVRMGEPVLRSAHAGIAALAAIQTKLGRW